MTSTDHALSDLAGELAGLLVLPGTDDWDSARSAWNLAIDQQPVAVVIAATTEDVTATLTAATRLGLRVAVQATGHGAASMGALTGTILLRTSNLREVEIDAARQTAKVAAGALWIDVTGPASAHGLTALAGTAADVGVVGYLLGGGLSWLSRSHGLAVNHILSMDVITSDGHAHRVDAENNPDLFWAMRGGGGDFAIVTAVEIQLFPLTEVIAGALFWPIEQAASVLMAWREWVRDVPDQVSSIGRLVWVPPLPSMPEMIRGKAFAVVEAVMQCDPAAADALLAPLRALGPIMDSVHPTPTSELHQLHMDPPEPTPSAGEGALLVDLDGDAIAALLAVLGTDPTQPPPLLSIEFRHLGGAISSGRTEAAVGSGTDAPFLMFAVGIAPTPEAAQVVQAAVAPVLAALEGVRSREALLNFTENTTTAPEELFGSSLARLRGIKTRFDPAGIIRSNHPIG